MNNATCMDLHMIFHASQKDTANCREVSITRDSNCPLTTESQVVAAHLGVGSRGVGHGVVVADLGEDGALLTGPDVVGGIVQT